MRLGGAWVLLAVVLSGCADKAEPVVEIRPQGAPDPMPLPPEGVAPLRWVTVHGADAALTPATPAALEIQVPEGAVQVLVNATLDAGGAYSLSVELGDCLWRRETPFVALGQTITADCGGVAPGAAQLRVTTLAGALSMRVVVAALTCLPSEGACPAPLPVTLSTG